MRIPCIILVLLFSSLISSAQQPGWYGLACDSLQWATSHRIDDIYFFNRGTGVAVTSFATIHKTTDSGKTWPQKLKAPGAYFRSIEFSDNQQYGIAGSLSSEVFRSTDYGETWTDISANVPDTGTRVRLMCGLAHYGDKFYGVGWWGSEVARFFRSNDAGQTWAVEYIDTTLVTSLIDIAFISSNECFVAGCRYYNGQKEESVVLRSVDTGHTWTKVFADTTIGGRIWKIQFLNSQYGYASIEPYYHMDSVAYIKTTDGGQTWNMHGVMRFPSKPMQTQGIGFLNPKQGWIGGYYTGMFETNDSGKTWTYSPFGEKLNRFFRVDAGFMYASGDAVYVYKDYGADLTEARNPKKESSNILHPVYPNPAKDKVSFEFDLHIKTNVVLELANTDSRTIYSLKREYMNAGHYKYDIDCSKYPPGNYIIWLGTDDIPLVRKFTILK